MIDFATLKADVAEWLNRQDLAAHIPAFVRLAEAEHNRRLRTERMLARARAVGGQQYVALPDDWLENRNVQVDGTPLAYITLEEMDRRRDAREGLGRAAQFFTVVSRALEIYPTPGEGAEIEIAYYARIPGLEGDGDSNWLLREHYDIYLYGALVHSAPLLAEDERLALWAGLHDKAIAKLQGNDNVARYAGATLRPRRRIYG